MADFLDQLKTEAKAAENKRRLEEAAIKRSAMQFQTDARDAMRTIYTYFNNLLATLRTTSLDLTADFDLEGYGLLENFNQGNYMLVTENPDSIDELYFSFECTDDKPIIVRRSGRSKISRQKDYMWSHGLRFAFREKMGAAGGKEQSGEFHVEPWVPVKISFAISEPARALKLTIKNLDGLEEKVHTVAPEKLNHAFLDELAKAIVRKPSRLNELLGYKVTDTLRMRLKRTLLQEAKGKQPNSPQTRQPRQGLLGKIKGLFGGKR